MNPLFATDFYKVGHIRQYPEKTELIYSNLTPRSGKLSNLPQYLNDEKVVFVGLQTFIKNFLIEKWNTEFFNQPKEQVVNEYKQFVDKCLGKDTVDVHHIEILHELGYLPIEIRAIPEGCSVPYKTPMLTIHNTDKRFFWLTNYLETVLSASLWKPCTIATTARYYNTILEYYANLTGVPLEFIKFQAHDFSMRGMSSLDDSSFSNIGHLVYFYGTDVIPSIKTVEKYYNTSTSKELIGCSVPSSEHSVMCAGGKENEKETFLRLLTEIVPTGIVSIVADSWDFWNVIENILPQIKEVVMNREGKLMIRPDSGDPVDILCGSPNQKFSMSSSCETKGLIESLWDIFGGTINEEGYKVLDSHIGAIYGDSITPQRMITILEKLHLKGFASSNIVFGVGSYTYQYVTRDTHGFAVKATYTEIDGVPHNIQKDPKTDSGIKKSLAGLLSVDVNGNVTEKCSWKDLENSLLQPVFRDGIILKEYSWEQVRKNARP